MTRPSLALRLDTITRSLLIAMGVTSPIACGGQVTVQGGSGGNGGSGGSSTATTDVSVSVSASSSTGGPASVCVNPQPVVIEGQDVGLDQCAGGQYRRRAVEACPASPLPPNPCCGPCPPGFVCEVGGFGCGCVELCQTDADCADGELCFCGGNGGRCVASNCATDGDCDAGQACTSWDPSQGCGFVEFACTTVNDGCGGDLDCDPGQTCFADPDGLRTCLNGGCAIGRPFLVQGHERTAPLVARADWSDDQLDLTGLCDGLDATSRERLADHWRRVGAMEHASVAAFARFSLQLLALGAPPELLERSHRAMADETRHARAAFALASAYAGAPVGPGPLSIADALHDALDVERFVALLIEEGCIGETVASLEASESQPDHPAVAAVLERIAAEEAEHAELAWRTLAWTLEAHPLPARRAIAAGRASLFALPNDAVPPVEGAIGDIVDDAQRAALRARTLQAVVAPCLDALLAARPAPVATRCEAIG